MQRNVLRGGNETRVVGAEPDYEELDLGSGRCGRRRRVLDETLRFMKYVQRRSRDMNEIGHTCSNTGRDHVVLYPLRPRLITSNFLLYTSGTAHQRNAFSKRESTDMIIAGRSRGASTPLGLVSRQEAGSRLVHGCSWWLRKTRAERPSPGSWALWRGNSRRRSKAMLYAGSYGTSYLRARVLGIQ